MEDQRNAELQYKRQLMENRIRAQMADQGKLREFQNKVEMLK